MTYIIVRQAAPPTAEQVPWQEGCCDVCRFDKPNKIKILPTHVPDGMEQLIELEVGDALDGPWLYRNKLGYAVRAYDRINQTKHELYKEDDVVRCWRKK